ncbi:MAG TPA: hypothetical protein VNJ70_17650 [Thermoanaerobaculia bacterium]|nr:hypothetical protein [Thermoanaerobaculia bacterium]
MLKRMLLASILMIGASGCAEEPAPAAAKAPPGPLQSEAAPAPAPSAPTTADESWRRLAEAQGAELERLRAENVELRGRLAAAEVGRQAAAAAADEQLRQRILRVTPVAPAPAAPAAPVPRAIVSAYVGPDAVPMGDTILVTGRLWNSGGAAAQVALTIELVENGRTVDTAVQIVPIGARIEAAYTQVFRHAAREGRFYTARVAMSY